MPFSKIPLMYLPPRGEEDRRLAAEFGAEPAEVRNPTQWSVARAPDRSLVLTAPDHQGALTLGLDLRSGPLARRLRGCRIDDPLPRAISLHRRKDRPTVLDATLGLGRDSLVLARLGCRVEGVDRIAAFCLLAKDAATRADLELRVHLADARLHLQQLRTEPQRRPEVVYLDPMFEQHEKAQVKKDMQVCRLLTEPASPSELQKLLEEALATATERVVVKRHAKLGSLQTGDGKGPSFQVPGEAIRFDVYLVERGTAA